MFLTAKLNILILCQSVFEDLFELVNHSKLFLDFMLKLFDPFVNLLCGGINHMVPICGFKGIDIDGMLGGGALIMLR